MTNPRPLASLFSSPRQLLDKARRDLARLEAAIDERDETAVTDAMIDACSSVYHIKDWVAAMHPDRKREAEAFVHASSKWISLCRDICIAGKHFEINRGPMPAVSGTDNSSAAGAFGGLPLMTICTKDGDHYAPKVVHKAIDDWERFLAEARIP